MSWKDFLPPAYQKSMGYNPQQFIQPPPVMQMSPQAAASTIDQQAAAGRQAMPPPSPEDIMRWAMMQAAQGQPQPQRFRPMPQDQPQAPQAAPQAPQRSQDIPTPPIRPEGIGGPSKGALYYLDPGDGGVMRPYFSKDGSAPNYPGMNAIKDESFDPSNATFMQKLMRGVPFA